MPNHPNRSKSTSETPSPENIRALRESAGLTQTQFGALFHGTLRAVQDYEGGQRRMHPGLFELAQLKILGKA